MIKPRNLWRALKGQLPLKRAFRNFFITRNAWGLFSRNSHIAQGSGKPKVMFNTLASAEKAAASMQKKHGGVFRPYKCAFCDGHHIGKKPGLTPLIIPLQEIRTTTKETIMARASLNRDTTTTKNAEAGMRMKPSATQANVAKLPELAYSVHLSTGQTVILKAGEAGFHDTGYGPQGQDVVDSLNKRLGVTKAHAAAMEFGSIFGYHVPGADADNYDAETGRRK